ncbi:DUF6361 family protein [Microbacterium sp. TPD7012]|uniref:DUF6361 family protein n=1 Tax=Microbacterium sp. TPD7012 TaxID=2171975 RepID=UPI000D51C8E2|nr:DUF6361 family protein [Microbacterium sp. TPD7012]PVE94109.1 hypothetical protein DC434_15240 [Microbacterium sp. TPD7012]
MASVVTWLDVSAEEQRRMRELAALFTVRDSRDELGLGLLRDSISDALFPGTSTLHTRARYLLFVPWCFQHAARAKPEQRWRRLDETERSIISPLRSSADPTGLLGERAGAALKNLPSSAYWSMLQRYGILSHPATRAEALAASAMRRSVDDDGQTTASSIWSVPSIPDGFPESIPEGFALAHDEATWLRDRILEHAQGSLLTHLVQHRPEDDSSAPWTDAAAIAAPERAARVLQQAEDFSAVMHGAQLLYNLMLASDAHRLDVADESRIIEYRERLEAWDRELTPRAHKWQLSDLLHVLREEHGSAPTVAPSTRDFITRWTSLVQSTNAGALVDDEGAKALIRQRERVAKGAKARLNNQRRLASWGGASGSARLTFRWSTVRGILTDIDDGLQRA